jgi:hypothetical protein
LTSDLRGRERIGTTTADTDAGESSLLSTVKVAAIGAGMAGANAVSGDAGPSHQRPRKDDPIHMLRALAAAETRQANGEAITAAAKVPPLSLSVPSLTPRRPAVTPGSRRVMVDKTPTATATATGTRGRNGMRKATPGAGH